MTKRDKMIGAAAVIVIVAALFSGFSTSSLQGSISALLMQRTDVLQKAYTGKISMHQAENTLRQIETYPLLTEDVLALNSFEPGQMDWIRNMEFLSVEERARYTGFYTYETVIRWHMSGLEGNYVSEYSYHVVLKETQDQYYLSEFTPLDEN